MQSGTAYTVHILEIFAVHLYVYICMFVQIRINLCIYVCAPAVIYNVCYVTFGKVGLNIERPLFLPFQKV